MQRLPLNASPIPFLLVLLVTLGNIIFSDAFSGGGAWSNIYGIHGKTSLYQCSTRHSSTLWASRRQIGCWDVNGSVGDTISNTLLTTGHLWSRKTSSTQLFSLKDDKSKVDRKKKLNIQLLDEDKHDGVDKDQDTSVNSSSSTENAKRNTMALQVDDMKGKGPSNALFFDDDDTDEGNTQLEEQRLRMQPFSSDGPFAKEEYRTAKQMREKMINDIILSIPIIVPFVAFELYEEVATGFRSMIDFLNYELGELTWEPADGGQYQAQIITPAVNGIVVPSISILFATLISQTVTTLRQRQLDIRQCINREAGDLRVLSGMVDSYPYSYQREKCHGYLTQYTSRLISECQSGVKINSLEFSGSLDSEMNGFLSTLNELSISKNNDVAPSDTILAESYSAVVRLNSDRSARITAMQTTFPMLHYGILAALGASIAIAFLIESNQEVLVFLNALQLKILWAMLCGTFAALATVCYDLGDPFRGSYQISNAVFQLFTIKDVLKASCVEFCEPE